METLNREAWLTQAAKIAQEELFKPSGYTVPDNIRYTVSMPHTGGMSLKNATIGQCWADTVSSDGTFEIFISPRLDDERQVFATLVHEIVHATVGLKAGHKLPFKQCALEVGLTGKMTATTMTDATWEYCAPVLLEKLGPFPHAAMNARPGKKQTTRMVKLECWDCGYGPLRCSRKVIDMALPVCPMCSTSMKAVS